MEYRENKGHGLLIKLREMFAQNAAVLFAMVLVLAVITINQVYVPAHLFSSSHLLPHQANGAGAGVADGHSHGASDQEHFHSFEEFALTSERAPTRGGSDQSNSSVPDKDSEDRMPHPITDHLNEFMVSVIPDVVVVPSVEMAAVAEPFLAEDVVTISRILARPRGPPSA